MTSRPDKQPERPPKSRRLQRDSLIVGVGLAWGTLELVALGARPAALTFITSVLLSPLVLRFDEARRNGDDR
jgi:hypothetical protein